MKKIFKSLILVAAAAMGFTACQEELQGEGYANEGTVVVSFVADTPETKTSVDTSGDVPEFAWDDSETFAVLEQTDALAEATSVAYAKVDGKAKIDAEFATNAGKSEYKYVTVYPETAYVSAESIDEATLKLPAEQIMTTGSYDPAADLMVSEVVTVNAQPTEAQMVAFTRLAAVAKMTLNNLELGAGEQVEKVIFTAAGKNLAGTVTADLDEPHVFTVAEGVDNVSVAATSEEVFFTVLPTTLGAGDEYTVTVITDKYLYVKNGVIPDEKSLVFEAGMVTRFNVNMSGVAPSEKWVLVRDASTLKSGDVVTIAAKNYNYVVGKQGNNYPLASQTEVKKIGDYLYHPIATKETTVDNRIQHYTLLQRDLNRVSFDFYNGADYEGDTTVGFMFAAGSNNSPKLQSWCDKNTLFDVVITDGVSTLKASEITGTYKWWRYYHSNYASSRKFDCTTSAPTGNYQICLYKLEGAVGTIPVIDANVTTEDVVIPEEGAQIATKIEEVVFNYVGDWNISVSDNADWLEVTYDSANNCLKYTAQENTSGKRDATVTITATLDGQDDITWPFTVTQKGAPQDISIEEFEDLDEDLNSTYRITGKITTASGNANGTWVIDDGEGNKANIKYLQDGSGNSIWGHDDINLAAGDVVTLTTVALGSSNGGDKDHPSIYKGHYRLTATPGVAADYAGGYVTIDVSTSNNGLITLPDTGITADMQANDFAELTYTGGSTATVTFTSENETSEAREVTVTFTYGLASVSVTVQQGINPANKLGYELVTDASTLAVGDEVIIVAKNVDKALASPTSSSPTGFPVAEVVKTGNVIYDVEGTKVQVFTLSSGVEDGTMAFDFTYGETGYRLYDSSNKLKMRATSYAVNASTSWTISIDGTGDASITSTDATPRLIKFNSATGTGFTIYQFDEVNGEKPENAVGIYKKQIKAPQQ